MRVNDLIDPEAVPYDTDYGVVVRSDVPVVVQHVRVDSRRAQVSMFASMGYAGGPAS